MIVIPFGFMAAAAPTPDDVDLLLNNIPYATGAFGLRKLDKNYPGSCIKVRESGGDTLADIGFDSTGDLDTTALLAHTGGNSGYVHTWYDQSGLGYNGVQTTNGDQPRIVNSGTVDTLNSKPAFYFNGGEKLILDNTGYPNQTSYVGLLVGSFGISGKVNPNLAGGTSGGYILQRWTDNKLYTRDTSGYFASTSTYTDTDQYLLAGINQESTKNIFRDGDAIAGANSSSSQTSVLTTIGQSNSQWSYGYLQEIIYYDEDRYPELTRLMSDVGAKYKGWSDYSLFSTEFDGVDDYVEASTLADVGISGTAFSVSFWIKHAGSLPNYATFLGGTSSGSWANGFGVMFLTTTTPDQLRFWVNGWNTAGTYATIPMTTTEANSWVHVVCVYDGTNTKIYKNGGVGTDGTLAAAITTTTSPFMIGRAETSTAYGDFNGNIDEVATWNTALTSGNVTTIFNGGVPADLTDLSPTAWWRMGDESGWPYLTNKMAYSKYSMYLDGVDDVVTLPTFGELLGTTNVFSVSLWVNPAAFSNYDGFIGSSSNNSWTNGFGIGYNSGSSNMSFWINTYTNSATGAYAITSNFGKWVHVVGVYDGTLGSANTKIYINGVLGATTDDFTANVNATGNNIVIGRVNNPPYAHAIEANFDDVSIFSTALSQSDVTSIYNNGAPNDISSMGGLVSYYKMGDGAIFPQIPNEMAYSKQSMNFDGVSSYVTLATPTSYGLGSTNVFSISLWFLESATTLAAYDTMISNTSSASQLDGCGIYYKDPYIYFWVNHYSNWHRSTFDAPIRSKWAHICAVYDGTLGSANIKIYVNDVLAASSAAADETANLSAVSTNMYLGRMGAASSAYAPGHYDDVSIFSSALSASDVTDIYNGGKPKDEAERSGLVGYYKMGDGDYFPTLTDSVGSNDGTAENMSGSDIQLNTPNGWVTAYNESAAVMIQGDTPGGNGGTMMINMTQSDIVQDAPT
tara:strand:- start:1450 stop:4344 length:2895 start_codon:yes stop_codon:yes gene_type:complete